MKKPGISTYRRPSAVTKRAPRSRTEAAVELVRLEFEGARLDRELEQVEARGAVARRGRAATKARAAAVIDHLSKDGT